MNTRGSEQWASTQASASAARTPEQSVRALGQTGREPFCRRLVFEQVDILRAHLEGGEFDLGFIATHAGEICGLVQEMRSLKSAQGPAPHPGAHAIGIEAL